MTTFDSSLGSLIPNATAIQPPQPGTQPVQQAQVAQQAQPPIQQPGGQPQPQQQPPPPPMGPQAQPTVAMPIPTPPAEFQFLPPQLEGMAGIGTPPAGTTPGTVGPAFTQEDHSVALRLLREQGVPEAVLSGTDAATIVSWGADAADKLTQQQNIQNTVSQALTPFGQANHWDTPFGGQPGQAATTQEGQPPQQTATQAVGEADPMQQQVDGLRQGFTLLANMLEHDQMARARTSLGLQDDRAFQQVQQKAHQLFRGGGYRGLEDAMADAAKVIGVTAQTNDPRQPNLYALRSLGQVGGVPGPATGVVNPVANANPSGQGDANYVRDQLALLAASGNSAEAQRLSDSYRQQQAAMNGNFGSF